MELWNEIRTGAKDAAAYTVKKTEELTNIAKLKIALHGEESKLYECFEDLGETFYLSQKTDEDYAEKIEALIGTADEIKAKIAELKKELSEIQGTAICRKCGESYSNDYMYCPKCGEKK